MSTPPSIKGRIFASAQEDLQKLLAEGALQRGELTRWLEPQDLPLALQPVQATAWYDVQCYARLIELLRDVEGGGHDDYLRQRGARSAERLLEAGLYAQLEYLTRMESTELPDAQQRFLAIGRDLKLLTTMSASILNFSRWEVKADPHPDDRYCIEVSEAVHFPDALGFTSEGFINRMASEHVAADLWRWSRVRPDLIVFRWTRPLAEPTRK